jgi:Bacterial regulatory protein, Fis family
MERLSPHAQISSSSRRRLARWLVGLPISVVERDLILETLAGSHGNRTVSARLLGVSVRTLRNKISEYSAEGFHIPRHESRDKSAETIVPTNTHPKDKAAAMPVALASMRRVAASDCGS